MIDGTATTEDELPARAVVGSNPPRDGAGNILILGGQSQTVTAPLTAEVRGTAAAETVQVQAGSTVSFGASTGDEVEFTAQADAYTFSQNGNVVVVNGLDGGTTEIAVNADSEVEFANGSADVSIQGTDGGADITIGGQTLGSGFDKAGLNLDGSDESAISGGSGGSDGGSDDGGGSSNQAPSIANQTVTFEGGQSAGATLGSIDASDGDGSVTNLAVTGSGSVGSFVNISTESRVTKSTIDITKSGNNIQGGETVSVDIGGTTVTATFSGDQDGSGIATALAGEIGNLTKVKNAQADSNVVTVTAATGADVEAANFVDNTSATITATLSVAQQTGGDGTVTMTQAGADDAAFNDASTDPDTFTTQVQATDDDGATATADVTFEVTAPTTGLIGTDDGIMA